MTATRQGLTLCGSELGKHLEPLIMRLVRLVMSMLLWISAL